MIEVYVTVGCENSYCCAVGNRESAKPEAISYKDILERFSVMVANVSNCFGQCGTNIIALHFQNFNALN